MFRGVKYNVHETIYEKCILYVDPASLLLYPHTKNQRKLG